MHQAVVTVLHCNIESQELQVMLILISKCVESMTSLEATLSALAWSAFYFSTCKRKFSIV